MAPSRGEEEEEEMAVGDVGDDDFSSLSSAVGGEASVSSSEGSSSLWKEDVLLVVKLWFAGFVDACCLHRAYFFCRRCELRMLDGLRIHSYDYLIVDGVCICICLWLRMYAYVCIHKVDGQFCNICCDRSRRVLKKTWQCFLLNGCIFLGGLFLLFFI